ncbi:MAG TPA: AAA family ATPase [Candidatus Dormibacteraeota bacterium]
MHLRAITLAGFKTFAQKTEIRFEGGVTAIVGPNGSGKTNILDAFKWVLGESSAKDLRGKRMDEVVYAGGHRRPRAAQAEVEIVIDNSDGRLPVDYEEVAIRRRVDRSGQSDYFLNGSRVRRRDLLELLASTGLTTDSYAIVTQRDIESIITCSPEQRRHLIEEAAQVRGVKAKRSEAADKLRELAANLLRLEDLRGEIEPRLEVLRAQAAAAREAADSERRLEILRGSIVYEEWREARDTHRRAASQAAALERRLEEARASAAAAESEFQAWRQEVQAAQDRRLQRQRLVGAVRLELSASEHDLAMAEERARGQAALAEAARLEASELEVRAQTAAALRDQLARELEVARAELSRVPEPPAEPPAGDAGDALEARKGAEQARRAVAAAQSALAAVRTRRQFLEESVVRLEATVIAAEAGLDEAAASAATAAAAASEAGAAAAELAGLRAELEGLRALRPEPAGRLRRVGDVVLARPGFEAALSAVLGPLVDAWAAPDEKAARTAAEGAADQVTVVWPVAAPPARAGSLVEHVRCEPGFEALAARLLGGVVVGEEVSAEGVYGEAGLLRSGSDPRVRLAARIRALLDRQAELEPLAARVDSLLAAERAAATRLAELQTAASGRRRLDETTTQLEAARAAEAAEAARLPDLEAELAAAEQRAAGLARSLDDRERLLAEHRAEARRLEAERARWQDRVGDLERQLGAIEADQLGAQEARAARVQRAESAGRMAESVAASIPGLKAIVEQVRAKLAEAERDSPEAEAELAEGARRLVALEEARVDARLKAGTLEGNLGLVRRDAELAEARMEEIRRRMPEGLAPEEVPGGKAREREMRDLERRLREIGPTNPLAESECAELEERYRTLHEQLQDIAAARADLESLVERLREEEESRYDAVFGAVASVFQEYFGELTGGGRCTLRHSPGDDGPRSGVEILVQPPRKKLQTVTLLSSGERSLASLALVMALADVNPSPFTIFDEVDAALDDANVGRFAETVQRLGRDRQYLVITHNHVTMAAASALYGVHLDESGCSHLVSVRLEDIRPARRSGSQPQVVTA